MVSSSNNFALTDSEAESRYKKYKVKDPFPSINPTLLNSAEISDYVAQTGMIFPFHAGDLKASSYKARLHGIVTYWDDNGVQINKNLGPGDDQDKFFVLLKNSIAFVQIECKFRLPSYIALRFNLNITNVHRGLLLGTGPLIDPGFCGKILIPLHNLTNNDYKLKVNDGLIWIEFTKTNPTEEITTKLAEDDFPRSGKYSPFPEFKIELNPFEYLRKAAAPHTSIRSSIPETMRQAKEAAESASNNVKRLTRWGLAGIILSLLTYGFLSFTFYNETFQVHRSYMDKAEKNVIRINENFTGIENQVESEHIQMEERLKKLIEEQQQEIIALERKYGDLSNQVQKQSDLSTKTNVDKDE